MDHLNRGVEPVLSSDAPKDHGARVKFTGAGFVIISKSAYGWNAMAEPTDHSSRAAKRDLVVRLLTHLESVPAQLLQRMQAEVPAYRDIDRDDLLPAAVTSITRILTAVGDGRPFTDAELAGFREHGEMRGRQGISMEDLLVGWRLAVRAALESLITIGRDNGITDRDLLNLSHDILAVADSAIVVLVRGHHDAERELAGYEQDRLTDLVRGILLGTLSRAEIRVRTESYGLDPDGDYYAIRTRATPNAQAGEHIRRLGRTLGTSTRGLTASIDGDIAGFLDHRPDPMPGAATGLGPSARLDRLEPSFRQATRAMTTAAAFGLTGVHDLTGLGLLPVVLDENEIGDELVRRYIAPLGTGDATDAILETVRHYLSLGMRADLAAEQLFVHHNTVRYRLRRYEELTGTNLRDPDRALEAWWALQRHRLTARNPTH